jgi:hypothetical protein
MMNDIRVRLELTLTTDLNTITNSDGLAVAQKVGEELALAFISGILEMRHFC